MNESWSLPSQLMSHPVCAGRVGHSVQGQPQASVHLYDLPARCQYPPSPARVATPAAVQPEAGHQHGPSCAIQPHPGTQGPPPSDRGCVGHLRLGGPGRLAMSGVHWASRVQVLLLHAHSPIRSILVTSRISGTLVVAVWGGGRCVRRALVVLVFTNSSALPAHLRESPLHAISPQQAHSPNISHSHASQL